jgi:hypothetical protein
VVSAPGESWQNIDAALQQGHRRLPKGSSLAQVLLQHRGVRIAGIPPKLTEQQILVWADAHKVRTGQWPRVKSGGIPDASEERWASVDNALRLGLRGLPGGSSLARLIQKHRKGRN